ncbi:hypothetical protein POTOM_012364 [Populus tomentosa]|uniref:Uncharacterized protein n=1 Tax=Populus tomentosa TaxID=118781 RepID=A0A8X8AAA6_POPTO|nr:hypothetical protein POTOM_012364 [Populus tomentosa]
MITLATTASISPSLKPPNLTSPPIKLEPSFFHHHCKTLIKVKNKTKQNKTLQIFFFFYSHLNLFYLLLIQRKKFNRGICRAALSDDTPFAVAISVCMLSSLLLPNTATKDEEEESDSGITTTDTRIAVMGIISFIPYFNWLSWVFAWLDTGKRRYAIYSLVYLAPYLRSNMSLSPEDSWLPIASIIFGIVHVQLEASIKNGDVQGFQLFSKAAKFLPLLPKKKDIILREHQEPLEEEREGEHMNLPSADKQSRNERRQRGVPRNHPENRAHSNGGWDDDDEQRKQ